MKKLKTERALELYHPKLPLIGHQIKAVNVYQRAYDGYINATALCQASGKKLNDYLRNKTTQEFLTELESDTGIPVTELVQIIQGGMPQLQGTWVHPQVSVNLATWASPKFAVQVSKWVVDWMTGKAAKNYKWPYHLRRYIINKHKIPDTHFSMLNELTVSFMADLEDLGYLLPSHLMPDISMGKMFSKWCRDNGYEPEDFPAYEHVFDDGKRAPVQARLYPNQLLTEFRKYFKTVWLKQKAVTYFKERDPEILPYLQDVMKRLTD